MPGDPIKLNQLDERLLEAADSFWVVRGRQDATQGGATGDRDRGGRAAVTGGGHIDGVVELVAALLHENAVPPTSVFTAHKQVDLPLYFRPQRDWDLVVVHGGMLVACMEFKSQVGPSFGNNYNNRAQEAVGDAHDMLVAYREGRFRPSPRPWIGYMMLLEDAPKSRSPVRVSETHFPVDPEYHGASYAKRYEVTITRLVRESLYDAAGLVLTAKGPPTKVSIPSEEISFRRMMTSLIGHSIGVLSE